MGGETGKSQIMHGVFWQRTKEVKDTGAGPIEPESDCGREISPCRTVLHYRKVRMLAGGLWDGVP